MTKEELLAEYRSRSPGMESPPPLSPEAQAARALEELGLQAPQLSEFIGPAMDLMFRRSEGRAKPLSLPWDGPNKALEGGLWPGLHVLVGATGEGKSQFTLQIALGAAQAGTPVLYVGLEMGGDELVPRLLALLMRQDKNFRQKYSRVAPKWSTLALGRSRADLEAALDYVPALEALPLRLEVAPAYGWSASKLFERSSALRAKYPEPDGFGSLPILVIIDYLQVIAAERDSDNRPIRQEIRERIGQASYAGRSVARDLGAVVTVISSISRSASRELSSLEDGAWTREPRFFVDLGKESGEIEYAADSVLLLCRGDWCPDAKRTQMHLGITKLRFGSPSWCHLDFDGSEFVDSDYVSPSVTPKKPSNNSGAKRDRFRPGDLS